MKGMFRHALLGAFVGLLAAVAPAQGKILVSQDLTAGDATTITVVDASKANQKVTVIIEPIADPYPPVELVIQLDGRGQGTATWTVLAWVAATFNADGAEEVMRDINLRSLLIL